MISAFRGFSAPIILRTDLSNAELASLMVCDSDPFNRWEASQQLASRIMLKMLERDKVQWIQIQQPLLTAFERPVIAVVTGCCAGRRNDGAAGRKIPCRNA